jgi:hypothetical protein
MTFKLREQVVRFVNLLRSNVKKRLQKGSHWYSARKNRHQTSPIQDLTVQQKTLPLQADSTGKTLQITLKNNTNSANVYAYITGQAIDNNYALYLLQADGQTPYYPTSPPSVGSSLQMNCAVALGAPGNAINVTIPHIAGGRIWFSVDSLLKFLLNPGPALVEPSVTNPSDPNINTSWAFAEFTFNDSQLYANVSFVDFVSLPISMSLTNASGATQTVYGLPANGLSSICSQLRDQTARDGNQGWANLIVPDSSGQPLRALSPNNGMLLRPNDFQNYYDGYVNAVLARYQQSSFTLQTNTSYSGGTTGSTLQVGKQTFQRPNTADIFSSNSGPFATGADGERNTIIPTLAAAFNRSTLLVTDQLPSPLSTFYQDPVTNHYSRIVHGVVINGKGYAFPYDDVPPSDGNDQSGYVSDGAPSNLTLTIGGL